MLREIRRNKIKFAWLLFLILLLVMVRLFEQNLFYDPFLAFFKEESQKGLLPDYRSLPLFFGLLFRYFLNSALSLAVIYVVFKDVQLLKFTSVLYLIFFVVLISVFFGMLLFFESPDFVVLFYVRRFLIQPLFLVIFLPAFYYQKKTS